MQGHCQALEMAQSPPDQHKDALALLIEKRDAVAKELDHLDGLIAGVSTALGLQIPTAKAVIPPVAAEPSGPSETADSPQRIPHRFIPTYAGPPLEQGMFFGMGLPEAGARALSLIGDHDHPQTIQQLWGALQSTGYTIKAADPISVLNAALRKRAKRDNDVVLLGNGEWGMPAWYTSDEILRFLHNQNGKPGRNNALHSERTRQGMKQAAMERGVHVGRKRKINPEMAAEIERMLLAGATITEVLTKYDLERWNLADVFSIRRWKSQLIVKRKLDDSHYAAPPPTEETPSPGAQLRLVQ
jgi:hypothetical protein